MIPVDRREVWRYMGCPGEPGEEVRTLAEEAIRAAAEAAVPRQVSRRVSLSLLPEHRIRLGELETVSESLWQHLQGCSEAILFAATLGPGVDLLLRRSRLSGMSRAAAVQAASAALIESFCDQCCEELEQQLDGLYLRPRFSPGYGDLSLSFQQPLLDYLDTGRRIGLTTTDSLMMVPTKSVSAVIGLTGDKASCSVHKCAACPKTDCPFRKSS